MNNLIYNLWEIAPHLNDIDSNCSSSCSLQGHNLHAQAMGFVHAFGFIFFFALKEIFPILIIKGEKLNTKVMQNIYICIRYHTLTRIRALGKLPEKCYLATLDVSSLYTNIDTDEGLTIVEEELGKTNQNKPSPKTLSYLLEKVLKLNNFTFGNEHYFQIKGTAMGTRVTPNFANVYMGRLEERFVYQTEWVDHIILWVRFIDDIFFIWKSDEDSD